MTDAPTHITVDPTEPPADGVIVVIRADGTTEHHDTTVDPDPSPVKVRYLVAHEDEAGLHEAGFEATVTKHVADQLVWKNIAEEVA